jgi:hypothetical protein
MSRIPNACRLAHRFLAIAVFASQFLAAQYVVSQNAPSPGQSLPATKAPTLEVLSADYLPETNSIQFKLVNRSQKAATDYEVAIGVGDGTGTQVNWHGGFGENLLNLVLAQQCRNAGEKSSAGNSRSENSWEGAIKPGDTYVHTLPANLNKSELSGPGATVRVVVAGVVWSDGSVEVDQTFPWAAMSIKKSREREKLDASDSAKVVAILNAHADDPDIQHRIGEAITSLQALLDEGSRVQPAASGVPGQKQFAQISPVVSSVLGNLKSFASLADPKEAFEAYSGFIQCQDALRSALLKPATSVASGQ